jgi:hypothetical protein
MVFTVGSNGGDCSNEGMPAIEYRDDDHYYVNVTVGEYQDINGMWVEFSTT